MAGYIGAQGQIRSGLSATIDELNIIDGVTATTAELNILDGVTSTAAELNILDGVTSTAAEINLIDGGTARGTTAIADGDGVLINDAGTMRMTNVTTLATYMGTKIGGGLEFISSVDASSSATLSFTGFDSSKYDNYVFMMANILPATNNQWLRIRLSVDGGSNYLSASDSYTIAGVSNVSAGDSTFLSFGYSAMGNTAGDGVVGEVHINGPHLNARTHVYNNGLISYANGAIENYSTQYGNGKTKAATVVDAAQFSFTSGNIASGTITMYGMVNS